MDFTSIMHEITQHYTEDRIVDTRLKDAVTGYRRSRDLARLSTCSSLFDPHSNGIEDWKFLRQIEAFYKKNASFADRAALDTASKLAFDASELQCRETNARIRDEALRSCPSDISRANLIASMRAYIRRVLGDFEVFEGLVPSLIKVTPGATESRSRIHSLPQLKMTLRPYISSKASSQIRSLYSSFGFDKVRPRVCDTNRIELVPKDWRKNRTIACEPEGNLAFQLAFDTWAKRRLRRFGIDLSDQSANQRLARIGSATGQYATVDFSSASDTIAYNTVAWIFPEQWFTYLDNVRSPKFRGALGCGNYEKFSSMGNGSTFCIETLLFASACYACGARDFVVYGDDVVIPTANLASFRELCTFLGFTINTEKTFSTGPIRESCGKEFFNGIDVTPVIVKEINGRKASLCHLINTVGSLSTPYEGLGAYLTSIITEFRLPYVPYNGSTVSGVWIGAYHARKLGLLKYQRVHRDSPKLDFYKAYTPITKRRMFVDSRGYYLWFLYRTGQVTIARPWLPGDADDVQQTSSAPTFTHRYERKWVVFAHTDDTPCHVYLRGLELYQSMCASTKGTPTRDSREQSELANSQLTSCG